MWRVCRGCVGWVCRARVSAGCVKGVSAARAGCVAGVGRVCQGCVAGVCARPDGSSVPRGPRLPPPLLPSAPVPSRLRVSSTRVSACVRSRGLLPLFRVFSASASPGTRAAVPLGLVPLFPGDSKTDARRTWLLFAWDCFLFFPGDSQRDARHTRVWVSPCAPHGAFIRRRRPPPPPSPPHRSTRNANFPNSQISPPR